MTLLEIRDIISRDDLNKKDYLVPVDQIETDGSIIRFSDGMFGAKLEAIPNNWAFSQMCVKLGIPPSYLIKCPNTLKKTNIDYWLTQKPKYTQWLFRTKYSASPGTIRAILSKRYTPVNNSDILDSIEAQLSGFNINTKYLSDEEFILHLSAPSKDYTIPSLVVANSEVGARCFEIHPTFYMPLRGYFVFMPRVPTLRVRHFGRSTPELIKMASDCLNTVATAINTGVYSATSFQESLKESVEESSFSYILDLLDELGDKEKELMVGSFSKSNRTKEDAILVFGDSFKTKELPKILTANSILGKIL